MPRIGTLPGISYLRRSMGIVAGTAGLFAALLALCASSASAAPPPGFAWGAQLPPRMSDQLLVGIFPKDGSGAIKTDAPPPVEAEPGAEPAICAGCKPPLTYHGGYVMGTTAQAGKVTITPIYWEPSGHPILPVYKSMINQYITDVAHDSGLASNVYSINSEYSRATSPAGGDQMRYDITAGTPITDTTPYPGTGCTPDPDYTACVTEGELKTRLSALLQANALPADLAHIYPVFFPTGIDFANGSGKHKDASFCAYHGAYVSTVPAGPVIFNVEPYPDTGCGIVGQFPTYGITGDPDSAYGEGAISVLSHEINESITDPQLSFSYGWYDSAGNEIGDECASTHGKPLGSTDTSSAEQAQQTGYNQVINGHYYFTQLSFSNATFSKFGMGQGCVGKAFQPQGAAEPTEPAVDLVNGRMSATPNSLPADGSSTSEVTLTLTRNNGDPVVDDAVSFNVATSAGESGVCGEISDSGGSPLTDGAFTDENGEVTVTYTASTDSASCDIFANDFESGVPHVAIITQGAATAEQPYITTEIPNELTAGGDAIAFDTYAENPGADDVENTRVAVYLFGASNATTGLDDSQVRLYYTPEGGERTRMVLTGNTEDDGFITGFVEPEEGVTLPGDDYLLTSFELSLTADAPTTDGTGVPLYVETDLDRINPADGSATNLEYTDAESVTVNPAAVVPPPPPPRRLRHRRP